MIMSLRAKDPKKVRWFIDAHPCKVIRSEYCAFNKKAIFTLSEDSSFALWNIDGSNDRKIDVQDVPNDGITLQNNTIAIAGGEGVLRIFEIKG